MWKLLRFLKPYRKESICAPLFKLLEVVFELLVPLVVAHMIDSGIGGADKGIIVRSVLLMITLGAIRKLQMMLLRVRFLQDLVRRLWLPLKKVDLMLIIIVS